MNRKYALFVCNDAGTTDSDVMRFLIQTYRHNAINPYTYIADGLSANVNGHRQIQIDDRTNELPQIAGVNAPPTQHRHTLTKHACEIHGVPIFTGPAS